MKFVSILTAIAAAAAASPIASAPVSPKPNLLIFTKTAGIPNGIGLVTSVASKNDWSVVATEDSSVFTVEGLSNFTTLVFIHTTGDFLVDSEYEALYQYLIRGGSWLGIHAAADFGNATPPWYNTLVGGQFEFHPCSPEWTCSDAQLERYPTGGNIRSDIITIRDSTHPSTVKLPQSHNRTDEWYSYRTNPSQSADYTVLATLNETYIDDITPAYLSMVPDHPISWYSMFEGKARAWYTGMGHTIDTYSEEYFIEHVTGGLEWVVGSKD
ncbi:ThuA-like domain-containing protein [Pyrenochaeta sp. MPI-SDFR-AT-0127]|nr:ThuA-like domain-containing protein [Pyrenochaeta sp. MPI-SDFR-AT-0127]